MADYTVTINPNITKVIVKPGGLPSPADYVNIASFIVGLATGIGSDNQYVTFPNIFSSIPVVAVNLQLTNSYNLYGYGIENISVSGFNILFTNIITETGLYINVIGKV